MALNLNLFLRCERAKRAALIETIRAVVRDEMTNARRKRIG